MTKKGKGKSRGTGKFSTNGALEKEGERFNDVWKEKETPFSDFPIPYQCDKQSVVEKKRIIFNVLGFVCTYVRQGDLNGKGPVIFRLPK